jgi:hypothetical protein
VSIALSAAKNDQQDSGKSVSQFRAEYLEISPTKYLRMAADQYKVKMSKKTLSVGQRRQYIAVRPGVQYLHFNKSKKIFCQPSASDVFSI